MVFYVREFLFGEEFIWALPFEDEQEIDSDDITITIDDNDILGNCSEFESKDGGSSTVADENECVDTFIAEVTFFNQST